MTDVKTAESLIIILRAMHDGYCPSCGRILQKGSASPPGAKEEGAPGSGYVCEKCGFHITPEEVLGIVSDSHQIYTEHMAIFKLWRKNRENQRIPPDPGEGYRLIEQEVDSPRPSDEFYLPDAQEWVPKGNSRRYAPHLIYRRKKGEDYHPVRVPWFDCKGNKTRPAPPYRDLRPRE